MAKLESISTGFNTPSRTVVRQDFLGVNLILTRGSTFSRRLGSICTDFSSTYGRIKYEILATAWEIMLQNRMADSKGTKYAGNNDAIARYDALWDEWRTLKAAHTCCPTLYKGEAEFFGNPTGINHMVDRYRK